MPTPEYGSNHPHRLPVKPMIDEVVLVRHGAGSYLGPIEPGDVFCWEPDLDYARELTVVTRLDKNQWDEAMVWSRPLGSDAGREVYNDESRFREAVVATMFNRMAT